MFAVKICRFPQVIKIPYPKNQFLVTLRSSLSTYNFFLGRGWLFPVSTFKKEYFQRKNELSSWSQKKSFNFPQKYWFWPFLPIYVHLQSRFSQRTGKNSKTPVSISVCFVSNVYCVKFWAFYLFWPAREGASRFASQHFPVTVNLASCKIVGRPFVACYACSFVYFHLSLFLW